MPLLYRLSAYKNWLWHALAFGLLFLIQAALALFLREPFLIVGDEAGYLAHARYLSGAAPIPALDRLTLHHPGYSLFIIPAFWLYESPFDVYRACLIINAFLMSALYLSLHYTLVKLLSIPRKAAILVSLIACLYPPLLLRSSYAWMENAYVPVFMLLIASFGLLVHRKSVFYALAFGLLLGFMYTIQPRSLALLPIAALYLILLGRFRAIPLRAVIAALGAATAVLLATRLLIEHLKTAGGNQIPENQIWVVFEHLKSYQGIHDFALNLTEQLLYLTLSTFGLFPVGALVIGLFFWQRRNRWFDCLLGDAPSAALAFFVLTWLASTVLVAAHPYGLPVEGGQLFKGRYVDGNSALFFALGLTAVLSDKAKAIGKSIPTHFANQWSWRPIVLVVVLIALSTAFVVYGVIAFEPDVTPSNALGVYPFLHFFDSRIEAILAAAALAIIGFTLFSLARGRLRIVAALATACLFLLFSAYDYRYAIIAIQDRVARTSTLAAYIRTYLDSPPYVAYDLSYYHPLPYSSYGYLLPYTRLLAFRSALGERPQAPIVISSRTWQDAGALDAQFWQAEPQVLFVGADHALWTLPSEAQSTLLREVDYSNTVLGRTQLPSWSNRTARGIRAQHIWGIRQEGLVHPPDSSETVPRVWFTNEAMLRVPRGPTAPQAILLNLLSTVERETTLRVDVNGKTLFADKIPPGNWCQTFPLSGPADMPHTEVELRLLRTADAESNTLPANMVVRGITLLDHVPERRHGLSPDPLPPAGYRSRLRLESASAPAAVIRGSMQTIRLNVANTSDHHWPTECELGQNPGSVQLGILWFRKHTSDRALAARVAEARAALPYALAPGGAISLAAILAPVTQGGDMLPPGEYEVWISPIQEGVAWFFEMGDEALKFPVRVVR